MREPRFAALLGKEARMKIEKERKICFLMIDLYCRHHHQVDCVQCLELKDFVAERLRLCPHSDQKTFCSSCDTPCYRADMQERICTVMRFSGPRMLLHHPIVAVRHLVQTVQSRMGKRGLQVDRKN